MATKDYSPKRTGNEASHAGKRQAFKAAKEERAPLATYINDAFAKRGEYAEGDTKYWNKLEDLDGEFKPKKFKK